MNQHQDDEWFWPVACVVAWGLTLGWLALLIRVARGSFE